MMSVRWYTHYFAIAVMLFISTDAAFSQDISSATPFYSTTFENKPSVADMSQMGRLLFVDKTLSASHQQSCASCHSPNRAFSPDNQASVQVGGQDLQQKGIRAVPSLTYRQAVPPFTEHFFDNDGNDGEDMGATGGFNWDGSANAVHEQIKGPLLSPVEMANATTSAVVDNVKQSPNAAAFRHVYGEHIFENTELAWRAIAMSLEVFLQEPAEFYPYNSKFDAFLRQQTTLTDVEQQGLALFNDPAKGNCASCHTSSMKHGAFPAFTDYGLFALGVPRNAQIAANKDKQFYDMGLCGPLRHDLTDKTEYCGYFKTPSLRNVAKFGSFFHNGAFHQLEDAVRFCAQRDSKAERIYPKDKQGKPLKYNDLPVFYQSNVYQQQPFGDKAKPLSDDDVAKITAFLRTLTDGYLVTTQ
jgi:cytochrome c peroxidase